MTTKPVPPAAHTATPWGYDETKEGPEIQTAYSKNGSPWFIASFATKEDALYTVRAVNEYAADKQTIAELLDALKTWQKFWDEMPKGQMGKLSFNVGLFNDGFVKMGRAIARAKAR